MNWNQLRDEAFGIAVAHGWHQEKKSRRHWMTMIMTEVAEAIQADRQNFHARVTEYHERYKNYSSDRAFEIFIKNTIEDELADIVIRCLDLAGLEGVDLSPMDDPIMKKAFYKVRTNIEALTFTEWAFELIGTMTNREHYSLDVTLGSILTEVSAKADLMDFDLSWFIEKKMKYNEHRRYKHGKQY